MSSSPHYVFPTHVQALLRAPFLSEEEHSNGKISENTSDSSTNTSTSTSQSAWHEVRTVLQNAVGGGMLAQLVQELLLCCQQGEVADTAAAVAAGKVNGTPVSSSGSGSSGNSATTASAMAGGGGERARTWGGAEEARAAAGCLHALCSFAPDATAWKKLLPGTFSGLFRAIRGIEVGSGGGASNGDGTVLLFSPGASGFQASSPGGRRGGRSKSALAETCLGILAKVLLICADGENGTGSSSAASTPSIVVGGGDGAVGGGGDGDGVGGASATASKAGNNAKIDNPLLALQRLAVNSNASSRSAAAHDDTAAAATAATPTGAHATVPEGRRRESGGLPSAHPSSGAPRGAAFAAAVIAVDDPEWTERTSSRLRLLLPPLLAFCCLHPGWRVRCATASLASDLLRAGAGGGDGNEGATAGGKGGGLGGRGRGEGEGRLLEPLAPLLMEALVGLLLDSMPQVSARCRSRGSVGGRWSVFASKTTPRHTIQSRYCKYQIEVFRPPVSFHLLLL